ncbi:MAG: mechanosensitive ion channel domain-containing protein [Nanoarchaeota archaeon]
MSLVISLREYLVSKGWSFVQTDWMYVLAIIIGFTLLSQIFVWLAEGIIGALTRKTKNTVDDYIISHAQRPITVLIVLIGIRLAIEVFGISKGLNEVLYHINDTLIILICTYISMVVVDAFIDNWGKGLVKKKKGSVADEMIDLAHKFCRVLIWVTGGIIALAEWGVNVAPFIASLGIAGIAIGFAVKDSLANIIGGIALILDKNIEVGDPVRIDNDTGIIKEIGLRSTKILTYDNEILIYPNGILSNKAFFNWAQPDSKVRGTVEFGVDYAADPDKVKKVAMDTLRSEPKVLKDPAPVVSFRQFGDSALQFRLHFWVAEYQDRYPMVDILHTRLNAAFKKNKIKIPFPQREVHMKK